MDDEKHSSKMTSEELLERIEAMLKKKTGLKPYLRPVGELAVLYEQIKAKYTAKRARYEAEANANAAGSDDVQIDSSSKSLNKLGAEA